MNKTQSLTARFTAFEIRRLLRAPRGLIFTVAFPVAFYLVNYGNRTDSSEAWAGTTWPIYFMVSMCSWAAISAAMNAGGARLAAERTSGWTRYLRLTPLPSWAYTAGKVLAGVTLSLGGTVVVAAVAAMAARPDLTFAAWMTFIGACWLGSLPFAALGILLGLVTSSSTAGPAVIAAMLTLNMLGGLLVPLAAFPGWLRDVAKALPTYRLGDIGWRTVAGQGFNPADVLVLAAYTAAFGLLAAWRYRADQSRPIG
jgi:ABC-2 type transport system permease protein